MTSRQSMGGGGRFAPITKANSRASMAPTTTSSSSTATSRQSIGGRKSLAPVPSSRQSLAPSSSRQSFGGRQSLGGASARNDDRRKSGGRRSSGAATSRNGAALSTGKETVPGNIRKTIMYLTSRHYEHTLSQRQFQSPSNKDFRNIVEFLFKQLDSRFEFPEAIKKAAEDGTLDFDQTFLKYMKRFGCPATITKSALQTPGSLFSWPTLLAVIVWMQEILQYLERDPPADGLLGDVQPLEESEQKMFFDYASSAYLAFLQGEDNCAPFDDRLARKFEDKNSVVAEAVRQFQARISAAAADIGMFKEAHARLEEYQQFVRAARADVPVLEENIANNRTHMDLVLAKKTARTAELEAKEALLAQCHEENTELAAALAAQPFTPLQVQEMLHQKATLEATLETQHTQAATLQSETWKAELEGARTIASIEKLLAELNEVGFEVSSASARTAHPFQHEEARFLPQGTTVDGLLSLDLRAHKEAASMARDAVVASKREVTVESKLKDKSIAHLADLQVERVANIEVIQRSMAKVNDAYTSERATMRRAVEESCAAVEDVELEVMRLRNTLSAGVERVPAGALDALDSEIIRFNTAALAEQAALKADICSVMQELTEHKVTVQEKLDDLLKQACDLKEHIGQYDVSSL